MESCEEARELQSCSHSNPEKTPFKNPAQFISDLARVTTRGSARFGTLSHHSFFSRHNPHPHRVTHLSGEQLQKPDTLLFRRWKSMLKSLLIRQLPALIFPFHLKWCPRCQKLANEK
ncbi:hypothetical protein MHYP_G00168300 [Metynnis hypsauchen]